MVGPSNVDGSRIWSQSTQISRNCILDVRPWTECRKAVCLSAAIVANAIMKVDGPYDVMLLRDSISLFTLNERSHPREAKKCPESDLRRQSRESKRRGDPVLRKCD